MAEHVTLARPYARAAFRYAEEHGALDEWEKALSLTTRVAAQPLVAERLASPALSAAQRAQLLADLCRGELPAAPLRFVQLLAEKNRLPLLGEITTLFSALRAARDKFTRVEIRTAHSLGRALQERLVKALCKMLGQDVQVETQTDEELIGGVLVRAGDIVIDHSIKGRLARLAEAVRA